MPKAEPTPLETLLIRRIAQTGPMRLADYMADCLMHPEHGYYATRDPFGRSGDFITAPEISQMFGELLGLCLAQAWVDQGSPAPFTLAELGPGRGTLMADLLRATRAVPGFHTAARITLVEASPTLRNIQRATLSDYPIIWAEAGSDLPDAPLFLIANEFFDALPIRQFTRAEEGWSETVVGLADGNLAFGRTPPAPFPALKHRLADTAADDVVEIRPAANLIMAAIGARIVQHGGAAIIIDYGNWRSKGDTLQALHAHEFINPLTNPGRTDLTAHVDFEALTLAAAPALSTGLTDQGALLARLGIGARAQILSRGLTGSALENHLNATQRLTRPEEMGSLFKALAIYGPNSPAPPGFD